MHALRGVRARLAATLVALVALTAAILGVGAYAFVDTRIHDQVRDDAADQARFDLAVLAPSRWTPDPTEAQLIRFTDTFKTRGVETIVDFGGPSPFVSRSDLFGALGTFSADFLARVGRGELAFEWARIGDAPALVVGGRMQPSGPILYFVHDVAALERTLEILRLALGAGALVLIVVALVAAGVVARGVLAPVEAASRAAERIEEGDLSARVPITSTDEFSAWAERFNRMAATLEHNISRLREAQAQNRRFVADVSHELRTPLTALVAEASILREHLHSLPPESRRAGEMLVDDVGRLRSLVDELMEISRFDAGAEQAATQSVDLVRLVETVVAARMPGARLDLPSLPLTIETDPRRLERILRNLLDNAAEHAPGAAVEIGLVAVDGVATLAVEDRGPGVEPDRLSHIFERFYKADPSRHGGSSGLGLAIVAEHAALLGGRLSATNREGGGLRIALELPVTGSLPGGDPAAIGRMDSGDRSSSPQEPPR
jgi:two-component system sensor histidine kinase MtrB